MTELPDDVVGRVALLEDVAEEAAFLALSAERIIAAYQPSSLDLPPSLVGLRENVRRTTAAIAAYEAKGDIPVDEG